MRCFEIAQKEYAKLGTMNVAKLDELGLFTNASDINDATMLTHVIFHPVQKSQNRIIEIVYTVRIQLS